jgi:hypothetical protein
MINCPNPSSLLPYCFGHTQPIILTGLVQLNQDGNYRCIRAESIPKTDGMTDGLIIIQYISEQLGAVESNIEYSHVDVDVNDFFLAIHENVANLIVKRMDIHGAIDYACALCINLFGFGEADKGTLAYHLMHKRNTPFVIGERLR